MKRRRGLTLVEVLVVLTITAMAVPTFGRMFWEGWVTNQRVLQRSQADQMLMILMKAWPREIRTTTSADWRIENGVFRAGPLSISQSKNRLVIVWGEAVRKIYVASDIACSFAIEKRPGLADCAVLNVAIRSSDRHMKAAPTRVRVVGCGKGEGGRRGLET